ncbi:hypothetical protein P152DRAFT_284509 [Eremomyces bilateralis CBS 781.70]|uniref:CCHC-type domain-containing protein n=1 Tax=Eremomyces bilateralis CBS 781.70 TaxID=1392243 RepID=A0A6G1FQ61_9PEZI|nr:uncharacterized protein P152DRAFT_284509 [Eremomyces bilateralis CBS 781.70]KAF1807903.1 hypothetical protein P152DRAFT_284509 [Eremomyces bilateralis CBS 781.70]
MQNKIQVDGHLVAHDHVTAIAYICAFLDGEPALFATQWRDRNTASQDVEKFVAFLDSRYRDEYEAERAYSQFVRLKQVNKPFPEFMKEHQRLQTEAQMDYQDARTKINVLQEKLSSEMRQLILPATIAGLDFSNYDKFVDILYTAHYASEAAHASTSRWVPRNHGGTSRSQYRPPSSTPTVPTPPQVQVLAPAPSPANPDAMDWTTRVTQTQAAQALTQNRPSRSLHPNPDNRPKGRPINSKEFQARQAAGVCFTCGNAGHRSFQCYYTPPPRRTQTSGVFTNGILTEKPQPVLLTSQNNE